MATRFCEPERAQRDVDRRQAEARARVVRIHSKGQNRSTDLNAIDEQVKEKRARQAYERNVDLAFDKERVDQARLISKIENEIAFERRKDETQTAVHNMRSRIENTTTWDINDPDRYKRGYFVKRGQDGTAAVSSAQSFDGEDHQFKERVAMQKMQISQWSKQQVAERDANRKHEVEQYKKYQAAVNSYNKLADDLECETQVRRQIDRENLQSMNRGMANSNAAVRRNQTAINNDLEKREVEYQTKSDFLTEHKGTTYRFGSDGRRRVPYHMKGFSDGEMAGIRAVQEKQRQELEEKRAREKAEDQAYAEQQREYNRMWKLREMEKQRAHTRDLMLTKTLNCNQNKEKVRRDQEMAQYLSSVTTSERYHSNFETSDR